MPTTPNAKNPPLPHSNIVTDGDPPPINLTTSLASALIPDLPPSAYYIPNFITPAEEATLLHHINNAPLPTWKILSHRRLQSYPSTLSPTNTLLSAPLPPWLADPIIPRILSLSLGRGHESPKPAFLESGRESDPEIIPQSTAGQEHIFHAGPHGQPNHCLVNEYLPGQGIHPHEDGSAYWPVVCTVSLGSHTVLDISPKRPVADDDDDNDATVTSRGQQRKWRILQERRSLLVSADEVYTGFLHGIEGVEVDEGLGREGVVNWDLLGDQEVWREGWGRRGTRVSLTFRDVLRVKKLGKAFGGLMR